MQRQIAPLNYTSMMDFDFKIKIKTYQFDELENSSGSSQGFSVKSYSHFDLNYMYIIFIKGIEFMPQTQIF